MKVLSLFLIYSLFNYCCFISSGMSSLFNLCQQFLLSLYDDISVIQPLLPLHIFSELSKRKEQEINGCSVLSVQYPSNNIDDEYVII